MSVEDKKETSDPEKGAQAEYIFFCCPNGHENYIQPEEAIQDSLLDNEIQVKCRKCGWQSSPYKPVLMQQQTSPEEILFWVYTSKKPHDIKSHFNLSFNPTKVQAEPVPQGVITSLQTKVEDVNVAVTKENAKDKTEDKNETEEKDKGSLASSEISKAKPVEPGERVKKVLSRGSQIKGATQKIERIPRSRRERQESIQTTSTSNNMREKSSAITNVKEKRNLGDTELVSRDAIQVEMPKKHLGDTVEMTKEQFLLMSEENRKKEEKIEPAAKENKLDEVLPSLPPNPSNIYVKGTSSWMLFFLFVLWLSTLVAIFVLVREFSTKQTNTIAKAIENLELSTNFIPPIDPKDEDKASQQQIARLAQQNEMLSQRIREVRDLYEQERKKLQKEQLSYQKLQKDWEALDVSYQRERRERQTLKTQVQELESLSKAAPSDGDWKGKYQSLVKVIEKEFFVEQMERSEQDFFQSSFSKDGQVFLYYQSVAVKRNRTQKVLRLKVVGSSRSYSLFQTPVFKDKESEIPFIYTWDGIANIALLTRVKGKSTIYHIRFQRQGNRVKIFPAKTIAQSQAPTILGAPSISSQKMVAWVQSEENKQEVYIYDLSQGKQIHRLAGGGDTSKIPEWHPNGRYLFFVGTQGKEIRAFSLDDKNSKTLPLSNLVYGRYLSISPNGESLAFFVQNSSGKGRVSQGLWNWKTKKKWDTLQNNLLTSESSRAVWSSANRFIVTIASGKKDKIVVQDLHSKALFSVFQKAGKITWMDWSYPDYISFTYKEGLFTRPYRIKFLSLFTQN